MFTLLQSATGPAVPLLKAAQARHVVYCSAQGIAYVCNYEELGNDSPYWDKVSMIRAWLAAAAIGDTAMWLDADAWIANIACDVQTVLPQDMDMAADLPNGTLHTGVLWVRASVFVKDWFEAFWKQADRTKYVDWHMTQFYKMHPLAVYALSLEWHGRSNVAHKLNIKSLHGLPRPQAAAQMTKECA